MTPEILGKLEVFLKAHHPLTQECHAVYLLVEIRKMLDREGDKSYPHLRFCANWSVHTDKDTTPQMKAMMKEILDHIRAGIASKHLDAGAILGRFVFMKDLRSEFHNFLAHYKLPMNLTDEGWPAFRDLLARVLVDQPINTPCAGIQSFAFTFDANGHLIAEINYEITPGVRDRLIFP